ncbi:MAG: hypothetical protein JWO57_1375 [Pseudonocardiales bacterium]|nr:hypothetical protein [Pseudonocardiales bacterium]
MSVAIWLRPDRLDDALDGLREGRTVVGGGAALASESFPPAMGDRALDLGGLGLGARVGSVVGAMATLEQLLADEEIVRGWPAVAEALRAMATPEVRRVATVGGTIAARLPTSDLLPALCAYHAEVDVLEHSGERHTRLLLDYLHEPRGALVLGVDLGVSLPGSFVRFAGRAGFAPALASVAGVLRGGEVELWAGAVAEAPLPVSAAALPDESSLRTDHYASGWYRRRLLTALCDEVLGRLSDAATESTTPRIPITPEENT